MMQKYLYRIVTVLVAGLVLAACSGSATRSAASQAAGSAGSAQGSPAMQLAIGMFQLESSTYPVEAAQAKTLLPLWKAARALGKSDSTADAEITGLISQIQTSLTAEQLQVVQSMTAEEMARIAQEKGFSIGLAGGPPAGVSTPSGSDMGGMGGPGEMGGPPGMMGGPPGSGSSGASAQTTESASANQMGSFQGVSTAILDAIIQSLKIKVQS